MELTEAQRDEIMRQIGEGFTSGIINDGEKRTSWELKAETWED